MKKAWSILLSLIIIFCASGCSNQASPESLHQGVSSASAISTSNKNQEYITLRDYDFKLNGYRFSKTTDGKDVIVISYDFINNSDKATSQYILKVQAFQGATSLKSNIGQLIESDPFTNANIEDIEPGESIENAEMFFVLLDTGTAIEFKVSPDFVVNPQGDDLYTTTIQLDGEVSVTETKAIETAANIVNYYVDIKDTRPSIDTMDGGDVAVINFSFSNLGKVDCPPSILKYTAYQNGKELERANFIKDGSDALDHFGRTIKSGYA